MIGSISFTIAATGDIVSLYNLAEHCNDKPIEVTYPKYQTLSGKLT
jgi:hypothetical protein